MPPPPSMDLRQRIVDAYQNGEGTCRELGERFGVAPSTVSVLTKNLEVRGTLKPLPNRGRQTFWQPKQQEALREVVEAKTDATLQQMAEALVPRLHRQLDTSAVWRGLQRLKLTRKKKTSTPPRETDRKSKRNV